MGMTKRLAEKYCEAMYPCDEEKRNKLFADLCSGAVEVTPERMNQVIKEHRLRCEGDSAPWNDQSDRQHER